jgi:glutathione-regulated potassium-efflux system ancillary protein KefG
MKNVLVISGHPDLSASRVSSTILQRLEEQRVTLHRLSDIHRNYQFDIPAEQDLLVRHDRIVFLFPLYWYSSPAIMKKWIDDVFTPGFAYARNGNKLQGKEFLVVTTVGAPETGYRAGGFNNHTMDELLRPFQQTVAYVGGQYLSPVFIYESVFIDDGGIVAATDRVVSAIKNTHDTPDVAYEKLLLKAEAAQIALIQ